MTDARAVPTVDATLNGGLGGWRCGTCRSADDWTDDRTSPYCFNCGTRVAELWIAAWYAFEL